MTSSADSGAGSLRQALLDAHESDTILFDPAVFPPANPVSIMLDSALPAIEQGHLTIDASNAGVILDGSRFADYAIGLEILSDWNTILGLQIINFPGEGIVISQSRHNTIGGDRGVGLGPTGHGNLLSANGGGIAIWGRSSSNAVVGNLVGTDVSGSVPWGNTGGGLAVIERSTNNTIGPGNVIAFNGEHGLVILDSVANRITQNSIHSNGVFNLLLDDGGNAELRPPQVLDFELASGSVSGLACADCVVEVFSGGEPHGDFDHGGASYEGGVTADGTGFFSLDTDIAFDGLTITATATDTDGNTSGFSWPTSGDQNSVAMQVGNTAPLVRLDPKPSGALTANRLGSMYPLSPTALATEIDFTVEGVKRLGLKWISSGLDHFDWNEVEESGAFSDFHVTSDEDAAIDEYVASGIDVMFTLMYWDEDLWNTIDDEYTSRFTTDDEIDRWLAYVRFIVDHFEGRVSYYHIWNEPEIPWQPMQNVELDDYLELVRRTVPVIREEDPNARIAVGGLAGMHDLGGQQYTFGVVSSDVMPLVDVITWNPFLGGSSPGMPSSYDSDWGGADHYYAYPALIDRIRALASAHGFGGEYLAAQMQWATATTSGQAGLFKYGEIEAAKYLARLVIINLGMDVAAGVVGTHADPEIMAFRPYEAVLQSLGTVMAGAESTDLAFELDGAVANVQGYGFALPGGERMLALWTDGEALDHDPGVEATLVVPGLGESSVMAIDVLHGFRQELVATLDDGNLVVQGLLVKDYPVILHFGGTGAP